MFVQRASRIRTARIDAYPRVLIVAGAALLSLFGSLGFAVSVGAAVPGNWAPVAPGDFPDPSVVTHNGTYYAFATQNTTTPSQTINIQESTSTDGVTWTRVSSDALPYVGAWAKPGNTWAPSVSYDAADNDFVMFYTATENQSPGYQCIGEATAPATAPLGPYQPAPTPMVCQDSFAWGSPTIMGSDALGGSIDPDLFRDNAGNWWLLWKNDGNRVGTQASIWSVPLQEQFGLLLPATGTPTQLLTNTQSSWEGSIIEGPDLYQTATGAYYLFFGGNDVGSNAYAIGWASCSGPSGPCQDQTTFSGPILQTGPGMSGPGGPDIFTLPPPHGQSTGQLVLAVAAWQGQTIGYVNCGIRPIYEADLTFAASGSPPAPILTDPDPGVTPAVGPTCPAPPPQPPQGYWQVASDGGVFTFGAAQFYGSTGSIRLNKPVVGMAATPDGRGYWLVASDGGIFAYGDAQFHGSTGSMVLNKPIIGMIPTADGGGYWLIARDGGVFAFGDAPFLGSTGGNAPPYPITAAASGYLGGGYWMVDSNGQVFNYGNASLEGSPSSAPDAYTISGIAPTHDANGYWLSSWNGNVADFGDAAHYGSMYGTNLNAPIVGITATRDGAGYWLQGSDGGIFTFGDAPFLGSMGGLHLNAPMVGITSM
ncbi:MAG TPA: glycoside hydrolase family 43 protein [Acidimicrobiales bacterium]